MSLFAQEQDVYVIDTSGLIKLETTFPYEGGNTFKGLWDEIDDLIALGCFRIIDWVEKEINSYQGSHDFLKKWVKFRKRLLVYETTSECYSVAKPIINEEYNTGFFDPKKQAEGREEADPYLIAYCIINSFTLITNESKTKFNKIPSVAKRYGVRCIDVYDFLRERELKLEKKKYEPSQLI